MNFLLCMSLGFAQEETDSSQLWMQLYEGQLSQIIEGNPEESIEIYNALLENIGKEHSIYADLHYHLALAQLANGQLSEAKNNLLLAKNNNELEEKSSDFYNQLILWEKAIDRIPYKGDPWVENHSSHWLAAFSDISPKEFSFQVQLPEKALVTVNIVDWQNQNWAFSEDLSKGTHTLEQVVAKLVKTGAKILWIEVGARNQAGQYIPFKMGDLVLK